jgi:hypothetical protein
VGSRAAAGTASASTGVMRRHDRLSVHARAEGRAMEVQPAVEFEWFVGVDWATAAHHVCVCDRAGAVRAERTVEHSGTALAAFMDWLSGQAGGQLGRVAVSIEVPRGAVVETLLERGATVFTINPKQVDRFRDRHTVAGAKDDRRDAWVLASALRTDPQAFRRVAIDDPRVIRLRELARADEDLVHIHPADQPAARAGLSHRAGVAGAGAHRRRAVVLGAPRPRANAGGRPRVQAERHREAAAGPSDPPAACGRSPRRARGTAGACGRRDSRGGCGAHRAVASSAPVGGRTAPHVRARARSAARGSEYGAPVSRDRDCRRAT